MRIVEYIGPKGVKTSDASWKRMRTPTPGDLVIFPEHFRKYPVSHDVCRITGINKDSGRLILVDGMGSAFLNDNGTLDVSGGPFFGMFPEHLEGTGKLQMSDMWNWGDNLPGAGMGVHYGIERPAFTALCTPNDFAASVDWTEESARQGGHFNRNVIPDSAVLHKTCERTDGTKEFWFDLRPAKGAIE